MLTGDEVGALLSWWIAERGRRDGVPATGVYAQSIVSGTLLERIATDAGWGYATTLTSSSGSPRCPICASVTRRPWAAAWTPPR